MGSDRTTRRTRRLPLLAALLGVVLAVLLPLTASADSGVDEGKRIAGREQGAAAPDGYWQTCTQISTWELQGTLCIDASGTANGDGVIGVGWWQTSAAYKAINLCWGNNAGGYHCKTAGVTGGGDSASHTWPTWIGRGCNVHPIIQVNNVTNAHGNPLCIA